MIIRLRETQKIDYKYTFEVNDISITTFNSKMKNSYDAIANKLEQTEAKRKYPKKNMYSNTLCDMNKVLTKPAESDPSHEISVMEFPCYLSLSDKTVKHGPSTQANIQSVSNKITDALSRETQLEFQFSPNGALWVCNYLPDPSDETAEQYSFTMNLWEREGDLLIETMSSSWPSKFSAFYISLLKQII